MTQLEFFTTLANGAKWGVPATISRSGSPNGGLPIDAYSIFDSKAKAELYASQDKAAVEAAGMVNNAYVGQIVTVWEKVPVLGGDGSPVIGEDEQPITTDDVSVYYIDADKTLKPVGIVPTGDGVSITVSSDGLVSLFGFAGAENGKLPMKVDGALVWKSLEDIGAGDGNDNTIYEFELNSDKNGIIVTPFFNGQPIMEGEEGTQTQKKYELILDVYTKSEADAKFLAKEDYIPYNDEEVRELITGLDEAIGDTEGGLVKDVADNAQAILDEKARAEDAEKALGERIDAIDFVDEDELAEALEPITTDLATKAAQTDLEALQARVEAFLDNTGAATEAIDTLQDLITYINEHDDVELSTIIGDIEALQAKVDTGDQKVSEYVTAAIEALKIGDYAKAADLTALAGRVEALEAKPFDTYATKSEVEAVDGKFADYTTTTDLTDLLADKADVDKVVSNDTFAEFQEANTDAIGAARSGAVSDVEAKGYAVASDVARDYATKTEVTEAVEGIENDLLAYAKTADVEADLAKKIESGSIAHADDERSESVTVAGTVLNIVVDAPTRAETAQMIADSIKDVAGEDSIPAVKADLQAEITRSTNKDIAHDNALAVLQGTATVAGSVAEAKAQADKGVADATKAQSTADSTASALAILTDGAVKTNTNDINTIKGIVGIGSDAADASHAVRIGKLEAADAAHSAEFNALKGRVDANEGLIANKANAIDVYTKTVADGLFATKADTYTKTEVDDAVVAAITGANLGTYAKVTDVEAIFKAGDEENPATGVLADEIARATAAEAENARVISVLVGEDSNKSVRDIAAEETAKIVAGAHEDYDTLKEIADFLKNDTTGAAGMANDIAALKATVGDAESGLVKAVADNTAAIAAIVQPKASTEVSVADDGTLGINEINVNKLVQTAGDTLILSGGSAN